MLRQRRNLTFQELLPNCSAYPCSDTNENQCAPIMGSQEGARAKEIYYPEHGGHGSLLNRGFSQSV